MSSRRPMVPSNAATPPALPGAAQAPHMAPYDGTRAALTAAVAWAEVLPLKAAEAVIRTTESMTAAEIETLRAGLMVGKASAMAPHCPRSGPCVRMLDAR